MSCAEADVRKPKLRQFNYYTVQYSEHHNTSYSVVKYTVYYDVQCSILLLYYCIIMQYRVKSNTLYRAVQFIVQCTVYSVKCTVYGVQCTVYIIQCTVYSIQYRLGSGGIVPSNRDWVHRASCWLGGEAHQTNFMGQPQRLTSWLCALCTIHLCIMHCALCTLHSARNTAEHMCQRPTINYSYLAYRMKPKQEEDFFYKSHFALLLGYMAL